MLLGSECGTGKLWGSFWEGCPFVMLLRVGKSIARLRTRWYPAAMTTQFLTDQEGKRVAVVLPVEEFDELMEDVSDLAAVAERRNEERFTLDQVKQRLIADGLLPD